LKERCKGGENQEEDISGYWVTLGNGKYWALEEEPLDLSLWRSHFGKGYGPVTR
jgi:hypothetical protein